MRICIDIDGTICTLRKSEETYDEVEPLPGAVASIQKLKEQGYYIIFCTARHMKTCDGNIGKVIARQGATLLDWLKKHNFCYDEIWFGKPYADFYIDDKALKFENNWSDISTSLIKQKDYINEV